MKNNKTDSGHDRPLTNILHVTKPAGIQSGFTLIELVLAILLVALFIPSLINVFSFSLGAAKQGESYTQGTSLAQEYMEAIYYLKENDTAWDWTNYPENNSDIDYYQPQKSGGVWSLGYKTTLPQSKEGYTSTVQILPVKRNGYDIDESSDAIDPTSRKILVEVTWKENGIPTKVNLVSYISKH